MVRTPEALPSGETDASPFTARLTIDVTPEQRGRIKITAFERGQTVADLVVVRPPEPLARFLADGGYLPHGLPLLKHVAALAGQFVCRIGVTITVDDVAVGEARDRDSRGRLLPDWQGCRVIGQGEVFLMNRQSANRSTDGISARCPPPRSSAAQSPSGSNNPKRRSDRAVVKQICGCRSVRCERGPYGLHG